tara:strand:+ start:336 stop:554 length:219 start_codon:yes stop_codon:yes gene_type:complete
MERWIQMGNACGGQREQHHCEISKKTSPAFGMLCSRPVEKQPLVLKPLVVKFERIRVKRRKKRRSKKKHKHN